MSIKAAAVAFAEGHLTLNVAEFCRDNNTSAKTFYKWVNRYRADGQAGLEERSRRPRDSPGQTCVETEEHIIRLRKELDDAGLDFGPTTIQWHLGQRVRRGDLVLESIPSTATIWRILTRRGLVVPEPRKRPKTALRRFEAPAPNEWWQIDAMEWTIATGVARVFNIIDDHSRVLARSRAVETATTEQAWVTFSQAAATWGLPAGVLSDNGLSFSGKLRGFEVLFEARLRDAGVRPFTGRPYHPQTTGKVERFQQTLKKWLRKQPLAADLVELQTQLDRFAVIYNTQRPHQGIGRAFPIDRWRATPASGPASEALAHPSFPTEQHRSVVTKSGCVEAGRFKIHLGVEYVGMTAVVIIDNTRANVFIDDQLTRHLELDPTRSYQPSNRPRGGTKRPRLQS